MEIDSEQSTPKKSSMDSIGSTPNGNRTETNSSSGGSKRKHSDNKNNGPSPKRRAKQQPNGDSPVNQTKNTVALLNELRRNVVYEVETQAGPVHAPIFTMSVVVSFFLFYDKFIKKYFSYTT